MNSGTPAQRNALRIESLYTAIKNADVDAIMDCYAANAHFRDIVFDFTDKQRIRDMWRLVCHSRPKVVEFAVLSADDRRGAGRWRAQYPFGEAKRPVDNRLSSRFAFDEAGNIIDHQDDCDPKEWARMALGGISGFIAGRCRWLRTRKGMQRLEEFLAKHPER